MDQNQAQQEEQYYDYSDNEQENYEQEQQDYYEDGEQQEQQYYQDEEYQMQQQQQQQPQNSNLSSKKENKHIPGLMDQDPELDEERRNLWKNFGRETGAGKALFGLYKSHKAPKINYPKLKTKTREPVIKEKKPCPQKTQIEYPEVQKRPKYKFHQINFVMRRKPEYEIKREIDQYFSKKYIPLNRGKNRSNMVQDLQKKFKDQRGALPKGAELPQIGYQDQIEITQKMKEQALKRTNKKHKNFSNHPEDDLNDQLTAWSGVTHEDPIDEMNEMFDAIMKEIEERQKFLDSIDNLNDKPLKEKIKQEIVERVSELQKVSELKNYYKQKQQQVQKK